ncbi:helix-turn-helix domain-containing protein [Lacticaseibacillus chiayiensis]
MTQDKFNSTRHYTQLTAEDRGVIEGLHHTKGFSIRKIAARLHRAPSTISRELNRGKTRQLRSNYLSYEAITLIPHRFYTSSAANTTTASCT